MNFLQTFTIEEKDIQIIINIGLGLIAGIFVMLGYIFASKKKGYSKNFAITILLMPVIVVVVIPLIATDLKKAISLAGIFALVRFRSIPGDSKDIMYIFFTLAEGIAIALTYYAVALVLLVVVTFVYILLQRKITVTRAQLLKITIPEDMNYAGAFDDLFEEYLESVEIKEVKTPGMGSLFTVTYDVRTKDSADIKEFFDKIRTRNGNLNVVLQTSDENFGRL